MTLISAISLSGAMLILAISPGPGVFVIIASALAYGFKQASQVVAGVVVGDLLFLLLAIYGLSFIAEALGDLFKIVKYAGGGYLIWLGIKLWRSEPINASSTENTDLNTQSNFFSGLSITLANPKVILFYLGFLPTFVDLGRLSILDVISIGLIVSFVLGGVMLSYAYSAAKAKKFLKSPSAQNNIHRVAGTVMISVGSLLVAKT